MGSVIYLGANMENENRRKKRENRTAKAANHSAMKSSSQHMQKARPARFKTEWVGDL